MLNMIVNAAHAVADVIGDDPDKKGVITVSTHRNNNWVEIHIKDTGLGIPEEIRSHIFDPFFTTKDVGKGTGQGLAISQASIMKHHNGTIELHSEIRKGTTFVVRLPIGEEGWGQVSGIS